MKTYLPAFLTFLTIFFHFTTVAAAKEPFFLNSEELNNFNFSGYERINPNLLIYPLKRGFEQLKLSLTFNKDEKRDLFYKLYDKRYKELVFIINSNKEGFIPYASNRYNSFAGSLKHTYPPDENDILQIKTYLNLLERLRDIFPANSANWEKIQQTVDTTRSLI